MEYFDECDVDVLICMVECKSQQLIRGKKMFSFTILTSRKSTDVSIMLLMLIFMSSPLALSSIVLICSSVLLVVMNISSIYLKGKINNQMKSFQSIEFLTNLP
jgi:hypothetical protein